MSEPISLSNLDKVKLDEKHQDLFDAALATNAGSRVHRSRKKYETYDLLALSQLSGRMRIRAIDLSVDLRCMFDLDTPVPTKPAGDLVICKWARLGLVYPESAVRAPKPGYSFLHILTPEHVWLPNVSSDEQAGVQALCLGAVLPAGVLVRELILMSYAALSMQTVQLDALDAAGVMNGEAAQWWKLNQDRIPLSRESFLTPPQKEEAA